MGPPTAPTIRNVLLGTSIAIRVVAVLVLVLGPWTDEASELDGWDAARFTEIADRDGEAWVDVPVEYPPGSVLAIDALAGDDPVSTNRRLVIVSAALEAGLVVSMWRRLGRPAAEAWLVFGLPLVPMGLVRFDMAVTVIAAAAALVLLRPRSAGEGRWGSTGLFAILVAAGAAIKVWPALLIAGAWAVGRRIEALTAAGLGAVAGVAWLVVVGDGLEPLDQVLSLRQVTGWHVESLPGALVALVGADDVRFERDAYRIGELSGPVVTLGRVVAVAAIAALAALSARRPVGPSPGPAHRLGLVLLGATAALLVTAPLLSPQFILWLTPWAALLVAGGADGRSDEDRRILALIAAVVVLTGATLAGFGPPNLAAAVPAALLTVRNLALVAVVVACLLRLAGLPATEPAAPSRTAEAAR